MGAVDLTIECALCPCQKRVICEEWPSTDNKDTVGAGLQTAAGGACAECSWVGARLREQSEVKYMQEIYVPLEL